WDAVEVPVRARGAEKLSRGNVYANLSVSREGVMPVVRVNEPVLTAILSAMNRLAGIVDAQKPTLDGVLGLKGVIDVVEEEEDEQARAAAEAAIVEGFGEGLAGLCEMRRHEGAALGAILSGKLDEIAALTARAEAAPGRAPEAIRKRLAEQVAALLETPGRFDSDRLHQEAILLAAKADIREELDRLAAHVAQARKLISGGGAVGRRLDFLAQEFNRETNTLCSKSNDIELTNIGLELKSAVEQFREQVQNLE
ncbi:MAG: YicC family protein, partial [Pseudorhodoplanes sp.]|nr:YicC family protein [Pseudorhodoplanes sp.]